MTSVPTTSLTHLQRLEAESIHILREVVAEADNPVMLYSIGKDSAVMLHLALKAFHPAVPPFPLLHVDTRWKFRDMYSFRDRMAGETGMDLLVHINPEGVEKDINPFTHGSAIHTDIMKTEGLKQALDQYGFDVAFGGARRDEEKSRAKERVFSFRTAQHRWDPKNQRPELWKLYNARKHKGESIRVFPLSNWTELDIWQYIYLENIPIVPLYYAAVRPVVERDGTLIMVDDERMPLKPGEVPMMKKVRFRTLGCYPLSGAIESAADSIEQIIAEIARTPLRDTPDAVTYSDLNYIALGRLIERITGVGLDDAAIEMIFEPLGLNRTFFCPPSIYRRATAASEIGNRFEQQTCEKDFPQYAIRPGAFRSGVIWGEVHDGNAHFMGGVAGHAGLFDEIENSHDVFVNKRFVGGNDHAHAGVKLRLTRHVGLEPIHIDLLPHELQLAVFCDGECQRWGRVCLGSGSLRQVHLDSCVGDKVRGHHEDDQQHKRNVDERRDIDAGDHAVFFCISVQVDLQSLWPQNLRNPPSVLHANRPASDESGSACLPQHA